MRRGALHPERVLATSYLAGAATLPETHSPNRLQKLSDKELRGNDSLPQRISQMDYFPESL
jgi:hypothetical protein